MALMNRNTLLLILGILTLLGLADAAYLSAHALASTPLVCDIQGLSDCNVVAGSPYSRFLGIPLAVYGLAFYGSALVLIAYLRYRPSRLITHALLTVASLGAAASLYFLYLQIWVIKALCVYCLASAVVSLLLFALAHLYWKRLIPALPVVIP